MALVAEPAKHAAQHVLAGRQAERQRACLVVVF